jgi:hypothetical protein
MQIELDYSFDSEPRYGHGKPPHSGIYELLNKGRKRYARHLKEFTRLAADLKEIPIDQLGDGYTGPFWDNGFFPGFDAIALYGFLATEKPGTYLEIGSGNSTKFAHHAIRKRNLKTRIISIDPNPRAEIDAICSEAIRRPLETVDLRIFQNLEKNSIVFFDGSHRCFMGSDVTVFFLEVLPLLRAGVLVHVHDIFLPQDYWPAWKDRYYSEQYLLAAWLLGGSKGLRVELPLAFVTADAELSGIACNLLQRISPRVERHGGSFWMRRI